PAPSRRSYAMTRVAFVVAALATVAATIAHADPPHPPAPPMPPPPPGAPGMPGEDPIGERVFPPELIMSHQADIGLDDKTRAAIVDEIQRFQTNVVKIEWDLRAAGEQLAKDLEQPNVDEPKTLAQADKVM